MLKTPARDSQHEDGHRGGHDQPSHEEVDSLKGVKPHANIPAKPVSSQEHNGWNYTKNGNVAENAGGTVAQTIQEIGVLSVRGARLGRAAMRTEGRAATYLGSAIGTKCHYL